jgi:Mor family transcriptional regulator
MNNHPTNLAWGSKNDNAADKIIHGTEVNGEQNGLAKLTEAQVIEMRSTVKLASMSTSQFYKHLAVKYSITISAVGQILNGRSWRHLLSEDELAKLDEVYNAKPKRASFTQDREGTKISNARRDEMIARRIAGESVVKLAEEYGLSRKHAGTIFRQAGLTKS